MNNEHTTNIGIATTPERQEQRHRIEQDEARRFAIEAARMMSDSHCEDVLVFDVRGLSDVADYVIIASGTSDRQMKSVGDDAEELAAGFGLSCFGREEDARATWIVIDLVDVVVHLFEPATRGHYDLEMLWGDAPQVSWRRHAEPRDSH
jgi:ribosome-associated protein